MTKSRGIRKLQNQGVSRRDLEPIKIWLNRFAEGTACIVMNDKRIIIQLSKMQVIGVVAADLSPMSARTASWLYSGITLEEHGPLYVTSAVYMACQKFIRESVCDLLRGGETEAEFFARIVTIRD